jgi:hypothetical protein
MNKQKGLICIQFWPGDKAGAMRAAKLIADIEPQHRDDVDFLFAARFDATHDQRMVEYVSRKFDVRTMTVKSRAAGHPWGCWVLWFSIHEWVYHMKRAGQIPDYKWVFAFEADSHPITRDWVTGVGQEWERLAAEGAHVVGAETFHWAQHINGNLMLSADLRFQKWLIEEVGIHGVKPGGAWDIDLFPQFAKWGVGFTPSIWNVCGKPDFTQQEYDDAVRRGVKYIHGVKSDDLYKLAVKNTLG